MLNLTNIFVHTITHSGLYEKMCTAKLWLGKDPHSLELVVMLNNKRPTQAGGKSELKRIWFKLLLFTHKILTRCILQIIVF